MRGRFRWWWVALAAALALAVGASWWMRPSSHTATPRTTALPEARTDLAQDALTAWLADRSTAPDTARLELTDVSGEIVAQSGAMHPDGTWAANARLHWAYGGVDTRPAAMEVTVALRTEKDRVEVTGLTAPGRVPLWLAGDVTASRSADTLVVTAAGIDHADYQEWSDRAVQVVRRTLPRAQGPLVVEVPATAADLERVLGAAPGTYANVAAVTASVDGSTRAGAPVHVFVNPEVMDRLEDSSAQVVLSHEATHALTGAALDTHRPIWLTEGFADFVALRDVDVPLAVSAGQIADAVRTDGLPVHLPDNADFDASSDRFGAEYEAAWLATVRLAKDAGVAGLVAFYDQVGEGTPVDRAMRSTIGLSAAELTRRWRADLAALVRSGS